MTKKKRPLCKAAALLLGILTLLLSACAGGNTPADTTGTQPAPAPSGTVRDLVGDYTIVYPTRATAGETAAAMQLAKFFGNSERPKADYSADGTVPSGARETPTAPPRRLPSPPWDVTATSPLPFTRARWSLPPNPMKPLPRR